MNNYDMDVCDDIKLLTPAKRKNALIGAKSVRLYFTFYKKVIRSNKGYP